MQRPLAALVQTHLHTVAQHKELAADGLFAQIVGEPVGGARHLAGAAVEGQQKQPVMHALTVTLLLAEQLDFAADLREQGGLAQLLIQIALMKFAAGFGPGNIKRIVGDGELARLFTQTVHAVDVIAKRSVLVTALLGNVVVAQQLLPHPLAHGIDGIRIDGLQAQALLECAFIQCFAGQQGMGEGQDFSA
ncbi:hypothetical protein [Pseudomonas fragi]|uniref:hypothetical protein n=1 Tax=Pseudomonas fragi TaxID=296 RepID=UPI0015CAC2D8|nr:hypothetical protein [Pseudomonas fragi]